MSFALDFLKLRRPVLNYVSPPICEVIFSSTGVVIILDPINPLGAPSGLALGGAGGRRLIWNVFPNAICYNVYESVDANDPFGPYVLVSECQPDPEYPNPQPKCYRVSAITLDGESALSDPFCISTAAPMVETEPATDVTASDAILNGIVNPNGFSSSVYFQWGLDLSYGNQTAPQPVGAGTVVLNFDDLIDSLSQNTTYHFRAVASNGEFIIFGSDEQFTTPGGGPPPPPPAPCSIFEDDNTSFGIQTLAGSPNTWSALDIGAYQWVFIDRVFQRSIDSCPAGCEAAFFMLAMSWTNTVGGAGNFPTQNTVSFPCCGGGFSSGYDSEAAAIANYLTQSMPGFFLGGANGTTESATVGYSSGVPGGPEPIFDLRRVLKLTVPQPQILTIDSLVGLASFCALHQTDIISPQWNRATAVRDLNLAQWKASSVGASPGDFQVNGLSFFQFTAGLVEGSDAPVSAATAGVNGPGAVDSGAHSWKIVFSTTFGGQSTGGPASNTLVLGAPSEVGLTNIPVGPAGITRRHIYRTLAGGSEYYFVDTIFNNTSTTYTDNTDDATLFNGGFVTQMKPASCFWACNIEVYDIFSGAVSLWAGVKLTGLTPEGTYDFSQPFIGAGLDCPTVPDPGMLPSITVSGTF